MDFLIPPKLKPTFTETTASNKGFEDQRELAKALNRQNIQLFNNLANRKKKTSQIITLKKKNGFLTSCMVDYKLNKDQDDNQYLTFVCKFKKFTKPRAKILIDSAGRIIGHNSATSGILNLEEGINIKKSGHRTLQSLIGNSGICISQFKRLISGSIQQSSATNLAKGRRSLQAKVQKRIQSEKFVIKDIQKQNPNRVKKSLKIRTFNNIAVFLKIRFFLERWN